MEEYWSGLPLPSPVDRVLSEISREYSLEGLMLKLKLQYLATWCKELTHWKRPWCWERLKAGGEGDDRGWDGWMTSPIQWTWVWVSSGSWWWTGRPGILQSMGSQRVRHNRATELNWTRQMMESQPSYGIWKTTYSLHEWCLLTWVPWESRNQIKEH